MKRIPLLLLVVLCTNSLFGQNIGIINDCVKGNFKVGFTHLTLSDYSRTFDKENKFRSIQLTIWYPASDENDAQPLKYKDYVNLFQKDKTTGIESFKKDPLQYGANDTILNQILQSRTLAIKRAKAEDGSLPLVLFAPGINEKSYSNAILCEKLASNGYIVASTSFLEAYSSDLENTPNIHIEPQIRDMEFILAYMRNFKNVNFEKIGLIGHSAGGSSAVMLALRNFNIDAVAVLDGSFIGNPGLNILSNFDYFDPKYLDIPFLHFISGYWRKNGETHIDFNNQFFNGIEKSESFILDMYDLLHQSFVSDMHLRFDNSGIDYKKLGFDQSEKKTDLSYFVIGEVIQTYFDLHLKGQEIDFVRELEKSKSKNPNIFDYEIKSAHNKK